MILKFVRFKSCIASSINVTTRVEQLPGESEIHAASSVLIGRADTEWHNGTALSWYETEPAWKTRNDRISVAPPEYCFVPRLSKPIFERRINWQRWNHGHYITLLCFCWSPESAWISPRFSAQGTHCWGSISWLNFISFQAPVVCGIQLPGEVRGSWHLYGSWMVWNLFSAKNK